MRKRYKKCSHCDAIKEIIDGQCSECKNYFGDDGSGKVPDVMAFRPHYNSSLGCYVGSQSQMNKMAAKIGIERYGSPINMRRG
jgi:hypothetical protein